MRISTRGRAKSIPDKAPPESSSRSFDPTAKFASTSSDGEAPGATSRTSRSLKRRHQSFSPRPSIIEETMAGNPNQRLYRSGRAPQSNHTRQIDPIPKTFGIGFDFGTTYSTIAYVTVGDPQGATEQGRPEQSNVYTIDRFQGDRVNNQNGRQVPTELLWVVNAKGEYKMLCGYEVHRYLDGSSDQEDFHVVSHVRRMKHLLDGDKDLQHEGARLQQSLAVLKEHGLIKSNKDVIVHILEYYFEHAKRTLQRDYDYNETDTIDFTFTVPVCWKTISNHVMASCIDAAMRKAQFGYSGARRYATFFMVNEAEAGASHALRSLGLALKRLDTFVLIDAGGGTIDLGLYLIANECPLRLGTEINAPSGAMIGASDLNERCRDFLFQLFMNETYLEDRVSRIDNELMTWFENDCKRTFNYNDRTQVFRQPVRGLRKSDDPRLQSGRLVLGYDDILAIFKPSLVVVANLMEAQVKNALAKDIKVDKVVLIGGFGDSPALKEYLRLKLQRINETTHSRIELITTPGNTGAAGVATGGIIRASDKRHGPNRIPLQSIGVYRHLHVNDITDEAILQQRCEKEDGTWLIRNTIEWIIKKARSPTADPALIPGALLTIDEQSNTPLGPTHEVTFKSIHTFLPHQRVWKGEEVLFASDVCIKDGYQRTHAHNKGKTTEIGRVVFDLTHLREWHLNNIVDASPVRFKKRCFVTVLIEMTVIGRDLKFSVRWPATKQAAELADSVTSFTVVAAFEPGTQ